MTSSGARLDQVLAVVEHEEQLPGPQVRRERFLDRLALGVDAERRGDLDAQPRQGRAGPPARPRRRRRGTRAPTWWARRAASRVLPTPPGPTSVTSRAARSIRRPSASSLRRPTKVVSSTGSRWLTRLAELSCPCRPPSRRPAARECTPSLSMTLATWPSAVRWEITSSSAMSLFDRPRGDQLGDLALALGERRRAADLGAWSRGGLLPERELHGLFQGHRVTLVICGPERLARREPRVRRFSNSSNPSLRDGDRARSRIRRQIRPGRPAGLPLGVLTGGA